MSFYITRLPTGKSPLFSKQKAAQPQKIPTADPWTPYQGKYGGKGWRNAQSGEIRYQDEKPGVRGPGKPEGPGMLSFWGRERRYEKDEYLAAALAQAAPVLKQANMHLFVYKEKDGTLSAYVRMEEERRVPGFFANPIVTPDVPDLNEALSAARAGTGSTLYPDYKKFDPADVGNEGFLVGVVSGVSDAEKLDAVSAHRFYAPNQSEARARGFLFGLYRMDEKTTSTDITAYFRDREAALMMARASGQRSIWDIKNQKEIAAGGSGRPEDSFQSVAEAFDYISGHEYLRESYKKVTKPVRTMAELYDTSIDEFEKFWDGVKHLLQHNYGLDEMDAVNARTYMSQWTNGSDEGLAQLRSAEKGGYKFLKAWKAFYRDWLKEKWARTMPKTLSPPDRLHLYRGLSVSNVEYEEAKVKEGRLVTTHAHNLDSWTMDPTVAKNFATRSGGYQGGTRRAVVLDAVIPLDLVLIGTPFVGFTGPGEESEVILQHPPTLNWKVRRVTPGYADPSTIELDPEIESETKKHRSKKVITKQEKIAEPGHFNLKGVNDYAAMKHRGMSAIGAAQLAENLGRNVRITRTAAGFTVVQVRPEMPSMGPVPMLFGKAWVRYDGPRGGKGWRNPVTGEIRYQEEQPQEFEIKPPALPAIPTVPTVPGESERLPPDQPTAPREFVDAEEALKYAMRHPGTRPRIRKLVHGTYEVVLFPQEPAVEEEALKVDRLPSPEELTDLIRVTRTPGFWTEAKLKEWLGNIPLSHLRLVKDYSWWQNETLPSDPEFKDAIATTTHVEGDYGLHKGFHLWRIGKDLIRAGAIDFPSRMGPGRTLLEETIYHEFGHAVADTLFGFSHPDFVVKRLGIGVDVRGGTIIPVLGIRLENIKITFDMAHARSPDTWTPQEQAAFRYIEAIQKDGRLITGYAASSGAEEFAEAYAAWVEGAYEPGGTKEQFHAHKAFFDERFGKLPRGPHPPPRTLYDDLTPAQRAILGQPPIPEERTTSQGLGGRMDQRLEAEKWTPRPRPLDESFTHRLDVIDESHIRDYVKSRAPEMRDMATYAEKGSMRVMGPLTGERKAIYDKHKGAPGACFYNAQTAYFALLPTLGERVKYVDGVAFSEGSTAPIQHAWIEVDGKVIDLTWPGDGTAYFGAEFSAAEIMAVWTKERIARAIGLGPPRSKAQMRVEDVEYVRDR